ncbi:MAG: hypothetical protein H0V79_05325 [Actinobacteria bacterium]|nr:hypothetical protein [Actinomycetota bacterium]
MTSTSVGIGSGSSSVSGLSRRPAAPLGQLAHGPHDLARIFGEQVHGQAEPPGDQRPAEGHDIGRPAVDEPLVEHDHCERRVEAETAPPQVGGTGEGPRIVHDHARGIEVQRATRTGHRVEDAKSIAGRGTQRVDGGPHAPIAYPLQLRRSTRREMGRKADEDPQRGVRRGAIDERLPDGELVVAGPDRQSIERRSLDVHEVLGTGERGGQRRGGLAVAARTASESGGLAASPPWVPVVIAPASD